jgi:hypothetical protein
LARNSTSTRPPARDDKVCTSRARTPPRLGAGATV